MSSYLKYREELCASRIAKILALVTLDTEIVGVLGRGFPTSFYRIHALIGGSWYGFENGAMLSRHKGAAGHPLTGRGGSFHLPVEARCAVVCSPLRHILDGYQTMPGRYALAAIVARGRELREQKRAAWAMHDLGVTPGGTA